MAERLTLEQLEELRHCQPRRAAELALEAAAGAGEAKRLALLGIYGSCKRKLAELDEAHNALSWGLRAAVKRGDRSLSGDFRQRLGYVYADRGELHLALKSADRAIIDYTVAGNRLGVAKALVDRGAWLYFLDRTEAAIESLKAGARSLTDTSPRSQYSAFVALGLCYRKLGQYERAESFAAQAEKPAEGIGLSLRGKLVWLRAELAEERGDFGRAEDLYAQAVEIYRSLEAGLDAGLATGQLVRIQYRQRRFAEAARTATGMAWLLEPLKRNRVVSAAIVDLIVQAGAGKLNHRLIESTIREIEKARARYKRRARPGC